MDEVAPRLYLGDVSAARPSNLKDRDITHVLSVGQCPPSRDHIVEVHECLPDIGDRPDSDILPRLSDAVGFIEDALNGSDENKVLVHCNQGISRSSAIACAYCKRQLSS